MKNPLHARRGALVAGLIAALALGQPARSLARQAVTISSEADAPAAADTIGADTLSTAPDSPIADRLPVEADIPDAFPFAQNEVPESFPSVGIAFGVGGYLSSFTSVARAFHAMEDVYRAGGFSVPSARDVRPGPVVAPMLLVRIKPWLEARFQLGRAGTEKTDKVTLLGGLVSGRYALSPTGKVSLFAGLGGGSYRFSFTRAYGVRVSPNDGSGGFYELEHITLEGGGRYWTTAGGLTLRAFPRGALEAQIQYVGTGDVSTDATGAGEVRVNMSGAILALSIVSFF